MGSGKRHQKPNRAKGVIDPEALRAHMQQQAVEAGVAAPPVVPVCLTKLVSTSASDREEGCVDITQFALQPSHHTALKYHKAHRKVAQLLRDENVHVRGAAAAALRNLLTNDTSDDDALLEEVVTQDLVAQTIVTSVTELMSQYPRVSEALGQAKLAAANAAHDISTADEEHDVVTQEEQLTTLLTGIEQALEENDVVTQEEQLTTLLTGIEQALEENFELASVVGEGSPESADILSDAAFLSQVATVVCELSVSTREHSVNAAVAAAELLSLLSADNDAVASFIGSGLSSEQLHALNSWIQGVPPTSTAENKSPSAISPRLLRLCVALAGTLVNCAPNEQNATRVLPIINYALTALPFKEWCRVLPLLSEDCNLADEVRTLAVSQSTDRLRSLQAAVDLLGTIVSFVCEAHHDEEDDEVAFMQNPHAALLSNSGVFSNVGEVIKDLLQPFPDATCMRALREATPKGDASTLQHLFLSVEVGVFGLASTLLMMLPVASLGPFNVVWRAIVSALQRRYELATADAESLTIATESPAALNLLFLQLESLAEMSWTVQRKDTSGASEVQPQDLDVFTRLAWSPKASAETKIFSVGTVSCVGMRYRSTSIEAMTACSRFCNGMLVDEATTVDVRAEAANSLMDLFDNEAYDETLYVPLGLHASLTDVLNRV
eukprot:CAMPEP_0176473196 /NCGR_PEP_ID=MMETSP0127-20121128/42165_1 /TAXON_ID=938130 /ORGANISM="Platyophrya macrostoma, Strain WH" /LENGTH=666 /DNA_ID=CAMNT_0017868151 /DNA_START=17 /DNA_END=2014 /DNA_ORIENTATION=+